LDATAYAAFFKAHEVRRSHRSAQEIRGSPYDRIC
jgi:hypothetical protein